MSLLKFSNVEFRGWKDSCKIETDKIEIIIPRIIGPRISYLSLKGKKNLMYEEHEFDGLSDEDVFHIYGGHRLWHGPQVGNRPEEPDNKPIKLKKTKDGLILLQETEKKSRIEKKMILHIDDNKIITEHFLTNHNVWEIECTAWGVTTLAANGIGIIPFSKRDTHYLPNQALTFWPWTKANDKRIVYFEDFLTITQDINNKDWWKMGFSNDRGWMAYIKRNQLFVLRFEMDLEKEYSDYGSFCESFCNESFLELETVSQLYKIKPGKTVRHIENWSLYEIPKIQTKKDLEKLVSDLDKKKY